MKRRVSLLIGVVAAVSVVRAADWPAWRGPTGQGLCEEANVPLRWSGTQNVKWKVPLAHQGNSTPVVSRGRVFVTQANTDGQMRSLLCFDRADGKLLWQRDVAYAEKELNWNRNWYCNASPATDGERVVVSFGSAGMYCYDFDGKELWKRTDLGKWEHKFGNASSPVLYQDLAILWCGPNERGGRNFLLAVRKTTGETVWEHNEPYGSWSTPLIVNVNGQDQLLLGMALDRKNADESQFGFLKGFDPKTGQELWRCRGLSSYVYTSPLYAHGIAVAMSGYNGSAMAVKLGGRGDITKDRLWLHLRNTQRVGSGVIVGDYLYMVEENAVPHCYELKTGKEVWQVPERAKGGVTWGSIVHAAGRLYVLMRNADMLVLAARPQYEVLAVNSLGGGEQTNSSPVISDGEIFIRTFRHLWCISEKK
ncbi:MAG: PQQ-like beta-propeller repeat protein [Gemmataceae bacterium]|nr:PQQ-like beta-propeller repeat protein [Gemmataceae bacterium]MDW8266366.1 PQQ-binding-like beta-propeller repeat protein [Gemmataceae bacterium]